MAKKEMAEKKGMCSWCAGWSAKDWFWALVSEGALYLFLAYSLSALDGWYFGTWVDALLLLVLLNVALLACPVVRKHYLHNH